MSRSVSSPRPRAGFALVVLAAALTGGCDDFRVGHPESLWLLWLLPALVLFYVYVFRTKTRLLRRFADRAVLGRLTAGVSRPRQVLKATLVILGALACVLTLAQPRYGFTWEEVRRQGVDIVVALDVSDSMLVEDAESGGRLSRLERAKREIADLLAMLEGDRIGLVAFAGTAFVECPLTLDYGAAAIFLDTLDTDLIPIKGTNLGAALRTSLEAFQGASHPSRAIILITDGEDHLGDALAAAEEAKKAGVRVFTIGIGRDEGAPIPAPGGGFRRRGGEIVLSRLDEPTLQKVALETGGSYVRSVTGDVDLEKIYAQGIKATLEDRELASKRRQRWEDRFQWVLGLALAALMIEPLVPERYRKRIPALALAFLMTAVATPSVAQPPTADADAAPPQNAGAPQDAAAPPRPDFDDPHEAYEAGAYDQALQGFVDQQVERPEDGDVAYNIAAARYQMRDYEAAEREFARLAAEADPGLRQDALYNLGNAAYRQGRLEEAVELYKRALELDPDDQDAKFNLEFVRDEIRRRHEEAQKRQQEQQQQEPSEGQEGESGEQQPEDGEASDEGDEQQQGEQEESEDSGEPQPGADTDGDGLADETERSGANPTDPENQDTDGDGLLDGEEDRNRNGAVDPGETDPNRVDSDGDGVPDGEELAGDGAPAEAEAAGQLTPEEAERYLQALAEGRPEQRRPRGKTARPRKDW